MGSEIDLEVLGTMMEARAITVIQNYDRDVIRPREKASEEAQEKKNVELSKKVSILWDHFQNAKGAWWIIGLLGTAAVILANHYWK